MSTWYDAEIAVAADKHGLSIPLVTALIWIESAGRTDAFRFEPKYWSRYLRDKQEWDGANPRRVASSYGLMQVMYPTALDHGYPRGDPPEGMFVPIVGLEYGCRVLKGCLDWAGPGNIDAALASYNGGKGGNAPGGPLRNHGYATKVLNHMKAAAKAAEIREA